MKEENTISNVPPLTFSKDGIISQARKVKGVTDVFVNKGRYFRLFVFFRVKSGCPTKEQISDVKKEVMSIKPISICESDLCVFGVNELDNVLEVE